MTQTLGYMEDYRTSAALPDENFIEVEAALIDPINVDDFEPTLGVSE